MLKIKIPFGFKMIQFDNLLTIYTGKIRIKADVNDLLNALQNHAEHLTFTEGRNYCTIISFCTTNPLLSGQLVNAINEVLRQIMHVRIDTKYNRNQSLNTANTIDSLPY